jgi:hypothetical protein
MQFLNMFFHRTSNVVFVTVHEPSNIFPMDQIVNINIHYNIMA